MPVLHNTGDEQEKPEPFELQLAPDSWMILQQGMRICARQGTGKHLDPHDKLHLAAKTGTTPHGSKFQSWAAGYFPFEAPRYAFCLRAQAGTSQQAAVPEAHKWLFASQWL